MALRARTFYLIKAFFVAAGFFEDFFQCRKSVSQNTKLASSIFSGNQSFLGFTVPGAFKIILLVHT